MANESKTVIHVQRGNDVAVLDPAMFESFKFRDGDKLSVTPSDPKELPVTWGNVNIKVSDDISVRVPEVWETFDFKGYRIPAHLILLTGAGPETFDGIGSLHIGNYDRAIGLYPDMTILDLGCGIGRDAFQLFDFLSDKGRYIGVDVTGDSIRWCRENITPRHHNFTFFHSNAFNELYNPHGTKPSAEISLPAEDNSVDRIVLSSVFTHVLEEEVFHYMSEFRRVLRKDGLVYANFFLYSEDAIAAANEKGTTAWKATFQSHFGNGVYGNDPVFPRGAVAYSESAMMGLIERSGLRLVRPFLKGSWSGLHEVCDDGQDAAILARA